MHEVVSSKSHFLISEVGCLSKDLLIVLFSWIPSIGLRCLWSSVCCEGHMYVLEAHLECCLENILGYFLRSNVEVGWKGKEKKICFKVAFDSPKCTATQEGSQFPLWRKKKKKTTKNGVISRFSPIHLPKPKNLKTWKSWGGFFLLSSNDPSSG